jgi:peptidoglycan/LPS O-acetylase OafA/YrhL
VTTSDVARNPVETTGPVRDRPHFPGFESLRALAAVMVVVHHAGTLAGPVRAGHLHTLSAVMDGGVAVFFVISGFLIYRPFVAAHLDGRQAQPARAFWWRRVLRIVPAYWVVLTAFWLLWSYDLGGDWWRYYLFLQIYSKSTALGGVVQAWSLCTEITFYLLVPFWAGAVGRLVARAGRVERRASVELAACGVLFVAGFASRAAFDHWWPQDRGLGFLWLPTNLDLFAAGMALAVVSARAARSPELARRLDRLVVRPELWWVPAGALFAWYAYRVGPAPFETGYAGFFWQRRQFVLALFTVLLLVPAVFGDQQRGLVRRLWSWRPLAWVGGVSYGLYLWHFDWMKRAIANPGAGPIPGAKFGDPRDLPPSWTGWVSSLPGSSNLAFLLAVGLGVGLVFAGASWYLLEQPLQRFKGLVRGGPPPVAAAPGAERGALGPHEDER